MKSVWPILIAAFSMQALPSSGQVYNILHSFGSQSHDGGGPRSELAFDGATLYGSTVSGGTNGNGTIYKINSEGSGYSILFNLTNSPMIEGRMVLIGDTLYGTTYTGGANNNGSIFKIGTNGNGFTELHSFSAAASPPLFGTNSDGHRPQSGLVTDGNTLYGTAVYGGTNGNGTIFKINTDGSDFAVIKTFSPTFLGTNNVSGNPLVYSGTNLDGAFPIGALVLDGGTLYGTTYHGGISNGVVFSVATNGNNFTVLKYFSGTSSPYITNADGAAPIAGLTLSGDALYGITVGGGVQGLGAVFTLKTNGNAFANLHDLAPADGSYPHNSLLLAGSTLYGTAAAGGTTNKGTIFMVQTNGTDFTVLHNFDIASGYSCNAKLILSSNVLFGPVDGGGPNNGGVLFGLTVLPHIMTDTNLGMQSGGFGFDYNGVSNQTAIIEVNTNLSQPTWVPLQTNQLTGAPLYFFDAASGQNPTAFYRIRLP